MEFSHFLSAMTPFNIALALFGVVAGTVIGSIPGLTATMALAVLVPITFSMDPASALILLGAIYTGAIYGGAYAAILLNTPGTPSAIATTFDGYPMAKRGDGDLAVALACFSSVFGGMVGAIALLLLAPPLSKVALAFGPVEYFWLSIFGLSLIASLSNGNLMKGLAGGAFGMILSTVGVAEISADIRLTFGSQVMIGGFGVVAFKARAFATAAARTLLSIFCGVATAAPPWRRSSAVASASSSSPTSRSMNWSWYGVRVCRGPARRTRTRRPCPPARRELRSASCARVGRPGTRRGRTRGRGAGRSRGRLRRNWP